jgi:hypothetical protein
METMAIQAIVITMPKSEMTANTATPGHGNLPGQNIIGYDWFGLSIRVIPKVLAFPSNHPARMNPMHPAI